MCRIGMGRSDSDLDSGKPRCATQREDDAGRRGRLRFAGAHGAYSEKSPYTITATMKPMSARNRGNELAFGSTFVGLLLPSEGCSFAFIVTPVFRVPEKDTAWVEGLGSRTRVQTPIEHQRAAAPCIAI